MYSYTNCSCIDAEKVFNLFKVIQKFHDSLESAVLQYLVLPFISCTNAFIDVDASMPRCSMLNASINLRNSLERASFSTTADLLPVSCLLTTTTLDVSSISVYTQSWAVWHGELFLQSRDTVTPFDSR